MLSEFSRVRYNAYEFEVAVIRVPELVDVAGTHEEALALLNNMFFTLVINSHPAAVFDLYDMLIVMLVVWSVSAGGYDEMTHDDVV
jgi:hypothetical protein